MHNMNNIFSQFFRGFHHVSCLILTALLSNQANSENFIDIFSGGGNGITAERQITICQVKKRKVYIFNDLLQWLWICLDNHNLC